MGIRGLVTTVATVQDEKKISPCFTCRLADYLFLQGSEGCLSTVRCQRHGIIPIKPACGEAKENTGPIWAHAA